jgi:hypothetical protein
MIDLDGTVHAIDQNISAIPKLSGYGRLLFVCISSHSRIELPTTLLQIRGLLGGIHEIGR